MFDTIVFDFDGTLAKLNLDFSLMKRQVGALASAFSIDVTPYSDLPVLEWVASLGRQLEARDQDLGKEFLSRCRLLITDQEIRAAEKGELFSFTPKVLQDLQELQVKVAVVSRNCTAAIKMVFPDILNHVNLLLARDDVKRVKPDPEHLLSALQGLGSSVATSLMVGDHLLDITSARRVGMSCAAVASGRLSKTELTSGHPDFLTDNVDDLLSALKTQGSLLT